MLFSWFFWLGSSFTEELSWDVDRDKLWVAALQDRTLVCPTAAPVARVVLNKGTGTVWSAWLPGLWWTRCFPADLQEIRSGVFGVKMRDYEKVLRGLPELRWCSVHLGCQMDVYPLKENGFSDCSLTFTFMRRGSCVQEGRWLCINLSITPPN